MRLARVASLAVAVYVLFAPGLLFAQATSQDMIRSIERMFVDTVQYTGFRTLDSKVAQALTDVDRAKFVPFNQQYAFENVPLPIGHGQTISQPYIVALMTQQLDVQEHDKILEIGTGSGYQAAILGELANEVYSIEIVQELAESASKRLQSLNYDNVHVKAGDGWFGWPEVAPFDKIIITAVAEVIPPKLFAQLKDDGLLVMPLGEPEGAQDLVYLQKTRDVDEPDVHVILPVQFVPMTGGGVRTIRTQD